MVAAAVADEAFQAYSRLVLKRMIRPPVVECMPAAAIMGHKRNKIPDHVRGKASRPCLPLDSFPLPRLSTGPVPNTGHKLVEVAALAVLAALATVQLGLV